MNIETRGGRRRGMEKGRCTDHKIMRKREGGEEIKWREGRMEKELR